MVLKCWNLLDLLYELVDIDRFKLLLMYLKRICIFLITRYRFLHMFIKLNLLISLLKSFMSLLKICCWFDWSIIDQLLNFILMLGLSLSLKSTYFNAISTFFLISGTHKLITKANQKKYIIFFADLTKTKKV